MKNLMVYISPTGSFDNPRPDLCNDAGLSVKVQLENSTQLGWAKEDILLVTNFTYEYGGIKAIVLEDVDFFERKPQASKINAIVKLFEKGLIKDGQLYWFHDLDAFQLIPITESELELEKVDMGLADYGRSSRWNTASIFFKASSQDIFSKIKEIMYRDNIDEERALGALTQNEDISQRVKKINNTYNFVAPNLRKGYKRAVKPLRVAHFHPLGTVSSTEPQKAFDFFKGENKLKTPLITERLMKIFNYHRIK